MSGLWIYRERRCKRRSQHFSGGARRTWGQFGYRKLLYVKLIFYHFWFFWKRNILDVKTVMRGH
ncbi:hypothetical protein EW842_22540 [Salmonella enterica subsp. enterica serovar Schwarzengrund]|uniref:Uncharacterized protein n=2 Tax=Salmonella enterica TaxID=28901 RepID=A0A620DUQ5_SALER|nr:hypothetical protein [Salmonella enterica]EAQ3277694.1 hypothetical protein [Salmonella enterica subsp. enterica]EAZ0027294.1 hypothetical protein [Salmonella enterica subsp. enterica serovar Schwarzengrund]EDR4631605.1 hypothetical protein [Salmonella enterica subsp. enterica serovar 4,[5],12:i:-]EEU9482243.1 hypothetical protein [Escherichia coli]